MNDVRPWTITYGGVTFTDDDLTAGDAVDIETLAGGGWAALNPWAGPRELVAIVSVAASRLTGGSRAALLADLYAMPVADLLGLVAPREA